MLIKSLKSYNELGEYYRHPVDTERFFMENNPLVKTGC